MVSISFGTEPGAAVQCGSELAAAQTPNRKSCGVGAKLRAWSSLNPSWPCRAIVNPQPDPGVPPRLAFETRNVMYREIWFALIAIVPTVAPEASSYRWPKPCTCSRRLHAKAGAIRKLRDAFDADVEVGDAPGSWTYRSISCAPFVGPKVGVRSRVLSRNVTSEPES